MSPTRSGWASRADRVAAAAFVALLFALGGGAGCAKHNAAAPVAPETAIPPMLVAVSPAPGATKVSYTAEMWAQFDRELDSLTVTDRNVDLRVDTERIPVAVTWEAATRRVRIAPLVALAINRTHTVTLGAGLADSAGTKLSTPYAWQFGTIGVRRPAKPFPPDQVDDESPFVTLSWDASEVSAGDIEYSIWASRDSAAVAARSIPRLIAVKTPFLMPRTRWPLGLNTFWSVVATNRSTGDTLVGPVWRLGILPASTAIDSVALRLSDWGHYDSGGPPYQLCFDTRFSSSGGRYRAAIRWDLRPFGPLKLASATLVLQPTTTLLANGPRIWGSTDYWPACDIQVPGPPHIDPTGPLAQAQLARDVGLYTTSADYLIAHLEAMTRRSGFYGYVLTSDSQIDFIEPGSYLALRWYRTGPVARP